MGFSLYRISSINKVIKRISEIEGKLGYKKKNFKNILNKKIKDNRTESFLTNKNRQNHTLKEENELLTIIRQGLEKNKQLIKSSDNLSRVKNSNSEKYYIDRIIEEEAKKNSVPSSLIRAMVSVESGYNINAVSSKGAMGLMQLMPETAKIYNVRKPFSPRENISAGVRHIRALLNKYNDNFVLALAAYNAGSVAVDREGKIPEFLETKEYIKKVMERFLKENSKNNKV